MEIGNNIKSEFSLLDKSITKKALNASNYLLITTIILFHILYIILKKMNFKVLTHIYLKKIIVT